ncbi:hypothetical protein BGZ67_010802 [Mortierella alpina]|nr:hypothetical protein BGZ67_010802 [Mortierella alpina]
MQFVRNVFAMVCVAFIRNFENAALAASGTMVAFSCPLDFQGTASLKGFWRFLCTTILAR